jgi:xanthine dehydrogenase YagR molybdenum-binding subunit
VVRYTDASHRFLKESMLEPSAAPLGAKGLGEPTAVSVAPTIANAVYHATGKRVRDLPITIEKLL